MGARRDKLIFSLLAVIVLGILLPLFVLGGYLWRESLAAEEARLILEKIKAGEPLDKVARAKGFRVEETGFFQPGDSIPKIGANQGDAETLYQLSAANPYPANPLFINGAHIVFKLKGTSKVDRREFEGKQAAYERMLLNVKQEEAIRSWLEGNKEALIKAKRISIKKHAQDL